MIVRIISYHIILKFVEEEFLVIEGIAIFSAIFTYLFLKNCLHYFNGMTTLIDEIFALSIMTSIITCIKYQL